MDNDSTNGTYIDGVRIKRGELFPNQVLRLGEVLAVYVRATRNDCSGPGTAPGCPFVGGPFARRIHEKITRVARTRLNVLVIGETGAGKDVVAQELHRLGRKQGKYVPINCAAIPKGIFESEMFGHVRGAFADAVAARNGLVVEAHKGTLFLDEVGEIPLDCQAKLNRVLELGEVRPIGADRKKMRVDVRIVAATLRDINTMVNRGTFRIDLKSRLMGETIHLPPLRERKQDIPLLARFFLGQFNERNRGTNMKPKRSFFERLLVFDWPENVRSLRTTMMNVADLHPDLARPSARHISDDLVPRLPSSTPTFSSRDMRAEPEELATDKLEEDDGKFEKTMQVAQALRDLVGDHHHPCADLALVPLDELEEWFRFANALRRNDFNKRATASDLGVNRSTVYRRLKKMKRHGIDPMPA